MKCFRPIAAATLAGALAMMALPAAATEINLLGGEQNLQQILNGITVGGSSSVNVATDQYASDERWVASAAGGSVSQIIIELAGYRDINSFGIYDVTNSANRLQLFSGAQGSGARSMFAFLNNNCIEYNFVATGKCFNQNLFGFYVQTGANQPVWYSESALNSDRADHMVAFQGEGDLVDLPSTAAGPWDANEFVLAFEDLPRSVWDYDYNDFVVMVESVHSVPEPGTVGILGMGLVLVAVIAMRRRRQTA
jgi:hypothetical protein